MNIRRWCLAGVVALATGHLGGQAESADYEWKFFTYFGVNDLPTNLHRAFAEDLTNG